MRVHLILGLLLVIPYPAISFTDSAAPAVRSPMEDGPAEVTEAVSNELTLLVRELPDGQSGAEGDFRHSFSKEDAPPYIHFRVFLHAFHPDADPRLASRKLAQLGFSDDEIPEASTYFAELYDDLEREAAQGIAEIACFDGAESLGGLQIRTIYNSFDDLRFALAAKYLAIAAAELAAQNHTDFADRLVTLDGSFRMYSTNHRLAWGDDDVGIQQNRMHICSGIEERLRP